MLQQQQAHLSYMTYGFMGQTARQEDDDAGLDGAAQSEREYVRKRLREELKREPTEEELDEWLRQHTEGY